MKKDNTDNFLIPADLPVIDWENCLLLANHKEDLAKTILNMFVVSLPETLSIINHHFNQQDWKSLGSELHKLLGGCSYAGTPRLKSVTKEAERIVREQITTTIPYLINLLNSEALLVLKDYESNPNYHL